MGYLGILGEIVPSASQMESDHGTGSLWMIFEMCHHSNEYIFTFDFFTSTYVEMSTAQR